MDIHYYYIIHTSITVFDDFKNIEKFIYTRTSRHLYLI